MNTTSSHVLYGSMHELVQTQPSSLLKHSQSVARLAVELAETYGCSKDEQDRIRMGGLLHDIGKQFIPATILEKEDRLSPAEFQHIQQHPWLGYSYLESFQSDAVILNTVLYHHERWNGSGYPYGLKGDEIPLGARICALADVWDALVSDRCYRSAWSMTQAIDLLWAGAGSLFDPQLTVHFLNLRAAHLGYSRDGVLQNSLVPPTEKSYIPALPGLRGSRTAP